jgi:hypothetical protein
VLPLSLKRLPCGSIAGRFSRAHSESACNGTINLRPSAVLKNALDYAYAEFNRKPIGFVGYGGVGRHVPSSSCG